jgi:DNA-binding MarR family transcriptional regulator
VRSSSKLPGWPLRGIEQLSAAAPAGSRIGLDPRRSASRILYNMTTSRKTKAAADAWRSMFDFFIGTAPTRTHSLARRGLTPNDSRALMALQRDAGQTMGTLAHQWECDPANATWVIDRLERLGYATRQASPTDRRAKLVALTAAGAAVKAAITREFYTPPPALLGLEAAKLEELERIFQRLKSETSSSSRRLPARGTRAAARRRSSAKT